MRLRELRERAHMTQGQVAQYAEVSVAYVSRLERGQFDEPSAQKLDRIARVLSTSLGEIMGHSAAATDGIDADKLPILKRLAAAYSRDELSGIEQGVARILFRLPESTGRAEAGNEEDTAAEQRAADTQAQSG